MSRETQHPITTTITAADMAARNPFAQIITFVVAYLVVAIAVSLAVAYVANPLTHADYLRRLQVSMSLFGCIWLYKAGMDTLAEFRDERGI